MFQDEAGFGRINKPKYCWCEKGIRPSVPCHHIREYRYAYGAVEPLEQIWKEIRRRGFRNEVFATLEKVVDRLCDTICSLTADTIFSVTGRDWIIKAFN